MPIKIKRDGAPVSVPEYTEAQRERLWCAAVQSWCRQHPDKLRTTLAEKKEVTEDEDAG